MSRPAITTEIKEAYEEIKGRQAIIATRIRSTLFPFITDRVIKMVSVPKIIPNSSIFLQNSKMIANDITKDIITKQNYAELLNHLAQGYPKEEEDRIKKKIEETFGDGVAVTEDLVEKFFKAVPDDFTFSEGMRHILRANNKSGQNKLILADDVFFKIGKINDSGFIRKLALSAFSDDVLKNGAEIFIPIGNANTDTNWRKLTIKREEGELKILSTEDTAVRCTFDNDDFQPDKSLKDLVAKEGLGLEDQEIRFFSCNGLYDFENLRNNSGSDRIKGVNYADSLHLDQQFDATVQQQRTNKNWSNIWNFIPYNDGKSYEHDDAMSKAREVVDFAKKRRQEEQKELEEKKRQEEAAIKIEKVQRGGEEREKTNLNELKKQKEEERPRNEKAIKLQAAWKKHRLRKNSKTVYGVDGITKFGEKYGLYLDRNYGWKEESDWWDGEDLKGMDLGKEDFEKISENDWLISEIRGDKIVTDGAAIVHQYDGNKGLYKFSSQVAKSAEGIKDDDLPRVSLAQINNFTGSKSDENRNLFVLATRTKRGTTENFVSKEVFEEIKKETSEMYYENLEYIAKSEALEQMLKILQYVSLDFSTESGRVIDQKVMWLCNNELEQEIEELKKELGGNPTPIEERVKKIIVDIENLKAQKGQNNDLVKSMRSKIKETGIGKKIGDLREDIDKKITEIGKVLNIIKTSDNDSVPDKLRKRDVLNQYLAKNKDELIRIYGIPPITVINESKQRELYLIDQTLMNRISELGSNLAQTDRTKLLATSSQKKRAQEGVSHSIATKVWDSIEKNKFQYDLDEREREKLQDLLINNVRANGTPDWDKLGKLLSQPIAHSPYDGVSILRPPGKDHIATVVFNDSVNSSDSHDTAYVYLQGTPECYVRIRRCNSDSIKVMRDKRGIFTGAHQFVSEDGHKKGDIVIDDGMIVRRNTTTGKYEEINLENLEGKFGSSEAKYITEVYNKTSIKAVSVGERMMENGIFTEPYRNLAVFFNGKHAEVNLKPKLPLVKQEEGYLEIEQCCGEKKDSEPGRPYTLLVKRKEKGDNSEITATDLYIRYTDVDITTKVKTTKVKTTKQERISLNVLQEFDSELDENKFVALQKELLKAAKEKIETLKGGGVKDEIETRYVPIIKKSHGQKSFSIELEAAIGSTGRGYYENNGEVPLFCRFRDENEKEQLVSMNQELMEQKFGMDITQFKEMRESVLELAKNSTITFEVKEGNQYLVVNGKFLASTESERKLERQNPSKSPRPTNYKLLSRGNYYNLEAKKGVIGPEDQKLWSEIIKRPEHTGGRIG